MAIAKFSKANAWAYRNFRIFQELRGKLKRTECAIRFRDRGPDEHGCLRHGHLPSETVQAIHQHIAAFAVVLANLMDTILRAFQRKNRSHLDWRKCSVIKVALDAAQRAYQRLVPNNKANAPSGHVVALR